MKPLKAIGIVVMVIAIVLVTIIAAIGLFIWNGLNLDRPKGGAGNIDNANFLYPRNLSTTGLSTNSTKFFVVLDSFNIFARPYFAENETLTAIKITDSSDFSSNFTKEVYNTGFTSDCLNKRMYILKKLNSSQSSEQVLDVIQYDDSNKFQRIKRVTNMFDGAKSITADWTTGNIYWTEYAGENKYAIKVTNKLFDEPEYVVQPTTALSMSDIQVYPKKKEIFFIQEFSIWYTSTSRNSTSKLLFSLPDLDPANLAIDYEHDELCFYEFLYCLSCVDIADSTRPINTEVSLRRTFITDPSHFTVSNYAFYWISYTSISPSLFYGKNVSDTSNEIAQVKGSRKWILSFFSSNCLFASEPNLGTTTVLP